MTTGASHHWGACRYDLLHDIRGMRQAKAEWIIAALEAAITRLPRCSFNDERREQIRAMRRGLDRQAAFELDFSMVSSRCA